MKTNWPHVSANVLSRRISITASLCVSTPWRRPCFEWIRKTTASAKTVEIPFPFGDCLLPPTLCCAYSARQNKINNADRTPIHPFGPFPELDMGSISIASPTPKPLFASLPVFPQKKEKTFPVREDKHHEVWHHCTRHNLRSCRPLLHLYSCLLYTGCLEYNCYLLPTGPHALFRQCMIPTGNAFPLACVLSVHCLFCCMISYSGDMLLAYTLSWAMSATAPYPPMDHNSMYRIFGKSPIVLSEHGRCPPIDHCEENNARHPHPCCS